MAEGDEEAAAPPLSVGDVLLKRYRIVELLAEGGHSLVYRAQDERLRRPACVKILRPDAIEPMFRRAVEQRFVQEAFLMARLGHPSTVRVYDFGYLRTPEPASTELPFQVCEMVSGGPLSRWVKKRGHLEPHEVLSVIEPLCRALGEVHAAGLVHLDVKPQNILMCQTPSGREPKLADFGIAEPLDPSNSDPTLGGAWETPGDGNKVLLYSVNWAAPEQMVGDPISTSSDVYSLALVTAYALTGRVVYGDSDPGQAYRMRKFSDAALGDVLNGAGMPSALIDLLLRACRFDPAERLGDVLAFGRQLQRCLAGLVLDDVTVSTSYDEGDLAAAFEQSTVDRSLPGRVTAASLYPLSVDQPPPVIAGRQLRFVRLGSQVDLEATEKLRLRASLLPANSDRPGLHILGLNCFVSVAGRRPSSAVTIDSTTPLEFFSPGGEPLDVAVVTFATAGPQRSVVMLAGHPLVVPIEECRFLMALDFGEGRTCALLYDR
jgi:serine/threonine protein kinase